MLGGPDAESVRRISVGSPIGNSGDVPERARGAVSLVRRVVGHKLGQFALVLIGAYLLFRLGVPWLSRTLTGQSAPVPAHLLWTIYMPSVLLVMLLFVSASEESWREFQRPLRELIMEQDRPAVIWTRRAISFGFPLLACLFAYLQ